MQRVLLTGNPKFESVSLQRKDANFRSLSIARSTRPTCHAAEPSPPSSAIRRHARHAGRLPARPTIRLLARVDAQREKLTSQLNELEATERVLARYSTGTQTRNTPSAKMPTAGAKAAAPARLRGRRRIATAKSAGGSRSSPSLNDQVLALATGKTQQEITAACKGARPNHVGAAIARHKRAGRVEERDGKLYATQPSGTEQRVAV
jgi:hypothetical protein